MTRTPYSRRWMVMVVVVAGLGALALSACGESASKAAGDKPATVEPIKNSSFKRVTLSPTAEKRLGIETARVQERSAGGKTEKVIPYAAVLYTPAGQPYAYTSPEPRAYVRQLLTVDRITGNLAYLSKGPSAGTAVVTVGGTELFGVEYEVEES